jgi:hypothetical protein
VWRGAELKGPVARLVVVAWIAKSQPKIGLVFEDDGEELLRSIRELRASQLIRVAAYGK